MAHRSLRTPQLAVELGLLREKRSLRLRPLLATMERWTSATMQSTRSCALLRRWLPLLLLQQTLAPLAASPEEQVLEMLASESETSSIRRPSSAGRRSCSDVAQLWMSAGPVSRLSVLLLLAKLVVDTRAPCTWVTWLMLLLLLLLSAGASTSCEPLDRNTTVGIRHSADIGHASWPGRLPLRSLVPGDGTPVDRPPWSYRQRGRISRVRRSGFGPFPSCLPSLILPGSLTWAITSSSEAVRRLSRSIAAACKLIVLLILLTVFFGSGQRIGEAENPGPAESPVAPCRSASYCALDDPDLDPFVDLDGHEDDIPEFQAAAKFDGARVGCVFKRGVSGLGYYKDRGLALDFAECLVDAPAALRPMTSEVQPWDEPMRNVASRRVSCSQASVGGSMREEPQAASAEAESEEEVICIEGRRRSRRRDTWMLESLNSTCERSARARLAETPSDIVCVQEHHKLLHELDETKRLSMRAGWKAAYDGALSTTGKGTSGGTGIAVREWVGIRDADVLPTDVEWPPAHRFSLRWVDAVIKGGILVASVYLETGSGFGGADIGILNMVGQVLRAYGRPFVLGGDWQMNRAVLEASGWLRAIGGIAVAPADTEFTCVSSRAASTIDFFVISEFLGHAVRGIWVDSDCTTIRTHHPVRMALQGTARGNMVQRYRRPCAFPVQRPAGCDPRPPDYEDCISALNEATSSDELNAGFVQWIQAAEGELVARHGLQDEKRYTGRGSVYRVVTVSAGGARGNGRPKSTGEVTMYRWLGDRLLELCHLWFGTAQLPWARYQHGLQLARRLQHYRCPFRDVPPVWSAWCTFRPWLEWVSPQALRDAAETFHSQARRMEHSEASARAAGWKNWAAVTAMADGARLGHRWTKPMPPWLPSEVTASGDLESAQQAADRKANEWHRLWDVTSESPGLSWHDLPDCADVALPSADELRETSKSFSRFTALGCDDLHPKHVGTLSEGCLEGLIAVLSAMLRLVQLPQAMALLLVVLLPKPEGGTRPIGLFPTVIRIFARWSRRRYAEPWENQHRRDYWYGERGRACDTCVWRQSLMAEYASSTGQTAVSALLDLHKAYEHVTHEHLQVQAVKHDFNWKLLRFLLLLYSMDRVILVGRIVTDVVRTGRTIVAGCSFATTLLRLALIGVLDQTAQRWPELHYAVVVDDIQLQGVGHCADEVVKQVDGAVAMLIQLLQTVCKLVISMKKFLVVGNSSEAEAVVRRSPLLRTACKASVRNLGVDYTCGKRANAKVRDDRVRKMLKRMPFFRRLRAAGAKTARLARTGINPALLYGAKVTGVASTQLLRIRRMVRSSFQLSSAGRSLALDLVLEGQGTDPVEKATCDPILTWCVALWDNWLPRGILLRTLSGAFRRVQAHASPWTGVRGPASAVVATLARIGWSCEGRSPHVWRTHRGQINIIKTAPRAVEHLAMEAVERWQWQEITRHDQDLADVGPTSVLEPVVRLLSRKSVRQGWGPLQQGNLKSLVVKGQWPQTRLFAAGLAETDACQICGARGTLWHRLFDCPALLFIRQQYGDEALLTCACDWPEMQLWTRCLLGDPSWSYPAPLLSEHVIWEKAPAGGLLEGECYGDGSGKRPRYKRLRRCGWGLMCYSRGVGITAMARGPLPGWQQDVPLAESYAFWMTLRHADVQVVFYTDCEFVRQTFEAGPAHSSSGWFIYAAVWRQIWKRVEDIGVENVHVRWIPAHTSTKDVADGRLTGLQRICNAKADELAKDGADVHPHDAAVAERTERAHRVVQRVARFLGTINAAVGHRTPRDTTAQKASGSSDQLVQRTHARRTPQKHTPRLVGNRLRCSVCLRSALTKSVLAQLPCRNVAMVNAHALRCVAGIVFCANCGSYSQSKVRGLQSSCPRTATGSRATALRRLLRGQHPKTGELLGQEQSLRVALMPVLRRRSGSVEAMPRRQAAIWPDGNCSPWGSCQCRTCDVLERLGDKPRKDNVEDALSEAEGE